MNAFQHYTEQNINRYNTISFSLNSYMTTNFYLIHNTHDFRYIPTYNIMKLHNYM